MLGEGGLACLGLADDEELEDLVLGEVEEVLEVGVDWVFGEELVLGEVLGEFDGLLTVFFDLEVFEDLGVFQGFNSEILFI